MMLTLPCRGTNRSHHSVHRLSVWVLFYFHQTGLHTPTICKLRRAAVWAEHEPNQKCQI